MSDDIDLPGAAWPKTFAKLLSDTKLFSDANTEDCDWVV